MIKYIIKNYDTKKAQYIVVAIHDSGLAVEVGVGLKDSISEIFRTLNQVAVALEANTVNMFYSVGKTLEQAKDTKERPGLIIEGESQRQETTEAVRDNTSGVRPDGAESGLDVSNMSQEAGSAGSRPQASDEKGKEG